LFAPLEKRFCRSPSKKQKKLILIFDWNDIFFCIDGNMSAINKDEDKDERENDHGRKLWAEVENLIETHLVPELEPGTFANYELFVQLGEDAENAVADKPDKPDSDLRALIEWAGNAFIYQMGFFRHPGEVCCEVNVTNKTKLELTDKQIYQLVIARMEDMDLKPCIPKKRKRDEKDVSAIEDRVVSARKRKSALQALVPASTEIIGEMERGCAMIISGLEEFDILNKKSVAFWGSLCVTNVPAQEILALTKLDAEAGGILVVDNLSENSCLVMLKQMLSLASLECCRPYLINKGEASCVASTAEVNQADFPWYHFRDMNVTKEFYTQIDALYAKLPEEAELFLLANTVPFQLLHISRFGFVGHGPYEQQTK
jgi:hypothetical protein